jgi:hypothetical protein
MIIRLTKSLIWIPLVFTCQDIPASQLTTLDDVVRSFSDKLVTDASLDLEVNAYRKQLSITTHPGIVKLDMNRDGNQDVALLLKDDKTDRLVLKIFFCRKACAEEVSIDLGRFFGIQYLTLFPQGVTRNKAQTLNSRHPAIVVTYFGKGQVLYFWEPAEQAIKSLPIAE